MEWKQKFKQSALEKGKAIYQSQKVFDLTETSVGYKASVMGRQMYQVSVTIKKDQLTAMRCSCPAAKGGVCCEHIAAVLYSLDADAQKAEEEMTAAKIMEQWLEMDAKLREEEKMSAAKAAEEAQKKHQERAADAKTWEQEVAAAIKAVEEKQRVRKEKSALKRRKKTEEAPQEQAGEKAAQPGPKAQRTEKEQPDLEARRTGKEQPDLEARRTGKEQPEAEARRTGKEQPDPEAQRRGKEQAEAEARRTGKEQPDPEAQRQEERKREERRLAREERKAQKARRKEEQKRQAEEAQRQAQEKRQAQEERREKIRQQKAEEAARKAEKRKKEKESQQLLEKKREEEKMRRQAEREMEEERLRKIEEEMQRIEEEARKAQQARERRKAEFSLLGDSWEEDSDMPKESDKSENVEKLENYIYFQGTRIRNSINMPQEAFKKGEQLLARGNIAVHQIYSGYEQNDNERKGVIAAVGKEKNQEFEIRIIFTRSAIVDCYCGCPRCRKNYYSWYTKKSDCAYTAGALLALETYLKTANMGDATDLRGERLLAYYKRKRGNMLTADTTAKESLRLVPRLIKRNRKLTVSFKIGGNKLLIVKKLDVFCQNVKNSATDTYGAKTQINHSIENFTEKGKGWIRFINRIVREEEEFQQRLEESRSYYGHRSASVGSELNLFGWRLDEFYNQLADEVIEFEDKDSGEKKKETVSCNKQNPKVSMCISAEKKDDRQFHGVKVEGSLPSLYHGTDAAYYIKNGYLNQVDKEFLDKIEPLSNLSVGGGFSFHVGRNNMSEFYQRILPGLMEVVEVKETEPEKFRSYLLPEARFTFYLDAEAQNVTCQIYARYGEREVSVPSVLKLRQTGEVEPFRDANREEEILYQTMQLLPEVDLEKEELHCGADEDLVYQMMESGTQKLMELGEVRCTQRFRSFHAVKSLKVSVGVSVASGLLELDIATEDIPPKELLEILASYRAKKKYYRMKDGSFVNLDDTSVEMLAELMDATHMKPKEFVKGKFHLPMYRTLYLDKMLEENEGVYSSRDSHFRKVVKGFKTVKDADFEEPESLAKIMRGYQKNGYKWLRTLENWQFGGILADDMGLGKTLQVISVLLAAKQEGREGTSLVIAPASLVYNWGEEFGRFAPELNVVLVTGQQDERKEKVEAYQEADVLVTSYDLLKRDIVFYEEKEFSYEIIDEAQYIKNHTTAAAKAVKVIKSRLRLALTGTPIENRLSELWSIFDFLMPGFLYSYDVFKKEIETPIVRNNDETALMRLQKMVSPFILRRLKEEVLKDLPDKLEESRYVRFGDKQQQLYDAQVIHMKETIAQQNDEEFNKNKIQILAELTRLRQICCDPSLCFENYKGEAAKLEACLQLVQSAIDGGHRMLLFSQFTSMLDILKEKLEEAKIPYFTITGGTTKEKRLRLVKEFNEGDVPVFLISLKAGGVGLNLTGADMVIHYDPWWNLAVQNQATDRAHRIGQTKKVTVYKLIAKNTIEEKIQKLQETKKNLAEQVIGGDGGQLGSMSREDILALLEV